MKMFQRGSNRNQYAPYIKNKKHKQRKLHSELIMLKKDCGRGSSRDEDNNSYYKEGSGKMGDFNWGVGGRQFRRKWTRDKYKNIKDV